jgi:nitroreductase
VTGTESEAVIGSLLSRVSVKGVGEPGPDDAQLRLIFETAVRAPDHGTLRPWRFFVVRGAARRRLSDLFVEGLKRREPLATEGQIDKEREKALRAPLTIAVAAKTIGGHKIPEIEQVLAVAAASMNILNASHALGFGAKWITGANCYDAEFRHDFGLEDEDKLIGFIQVGTSLAKPAIERPDPAQFVVEWGK